MKNIMLDLETMDNKPTSAIVAIGAVKFGKKGLGEEFYVNVDLQSCLDYGLSVSGSTIQWWMKQSDAARKRLYSTEQLPLVHALYDFTKFAGEDAVIWGNGSDFDNAILANAYRACAIEQPWDFWNNRCYRTMKNIFKSVPLPERTGTHHNALDDAKFQAEHLVRILGG